MLKIYACNINSKQQKGLSVGRWSKQGCVNSAREYDHLQTWIRERKTAYLAARNNRWLEECCEHMLGKKELSEIWTLDECKNIALKFASREEWYYEEPNSYKTAIKNRWLDKCCVHMEETRCNVTKQDCLNAATTFLTLDDFFKNNQFYFKIARENGWLPDIKSIYYERNTRLWIEKNMGDTDG